MGITIYHYNRLVCRPNTRLYKISIAYCHLKHITIHKGLTKMINSFIETLPKHQQDELIKHFDSMTPNEISFPGRIK